MRKQELRKIIAETLRIIVEAEEDELIDDASTSVDPEEEDAADVLESGLDVKQGVVPTKDFLDTKEGRDPKVRELLLSDPQAEQEISVNDTSSECSGFKPTQSEISLANSIGWPLSNIGSLENIPSGDPTGGHGNEPGEDGKTAPNRVVTSGDLIIDGHHRWSQCFAIGGPSNALLITDLGLPGANPSEKLAVAQVGIVATMQNTEPVPGEDKGVPDNVLGKSKEFIKKLILSKVGENMDSGKPLLGDEWCESAKSNEVAQGFFGLDENMTKEQVVENVADKVADNMSKLPKQAKNSPARAYMPQFSMKTDPQDVFNNLESGKVNYKEPFNESIDMKRWNKLAGF